MSSHYCEHTHKPLCVHDCSWLEPFRKFETLRPMAACRSLLTIGLVVCGTPKPITSFSPSFKNTKMKPMYCSKIVDCESHSQLFLNTDTLGFTGRQMLMLWVGRPVQPPTQASALDELGKKLSNQLSYKLSCGQMDQAELDVNH